jgi:hypothetical protein
MKPAEWYARGVRLLGRTAVECTRDSLGDCIGRDVANVAASLPPQTRFTVIDPFAGSCNTLYWILRHVPHSVGIAFESDRRVYEITKRNIERLDRTIALKHGDYEWLMDSQEVAGDHAIIVFVAPPWVQLLTKRSGSICDRRCHRSRTSSAESGGNIQATRFCSLHRSTRRLILNHLRNYRRYSIGRSFGSMVSTLQRL